MMPLIHSHVKFGEVYYTHMKYSEFLQNDRPCPFCNPKPEDIILETEHAYLTYALAPYAPDHLLTVPKRHIEHLLDITHVEADEIDELQNRGWGILQKLGHKSVSYIVREGEGSGRTVTHIHYHVIPDVRLGDVDHNGDARHILDERGIRETLARVRSVLK